MSSSLPATKQGAEDDEKTLQTFLQEIRVLVPGAQIVGAFLFSVPFQQRFESLSSSQRGVFVTIFIMTMLALVLFLAPAAYHRIAAPIHEKRKFVALGTRLLLLGFVPLAISLVLSTYLVTALVLGEVASKLIAGFFAALLFGAWWVAPTRRLHERLREPGK